MIDQTEMVLSLRPQESVATMQEFLPLYDKISREARMVLGKRMRADDRDDAVQEVCISAWEQWSVDPGYFLRRNVGGWVQVAVRNWLLNEVVSRAARHRRERRYAESYARTTRVWMDPLLNLTYGELRNAVVHGLAQLEPRCREVLMKVRWGGLSYKEAAGTLGLSFRCVGAYVVQAHVRLSETLTAWRDQ